MPRVKKIRCLQCGNREELENLDCLGACGSNVFCAICDCEFDPVSRKVHECSLSAWDASAIREGTPHGFTECVDGKPFKLRLVRGDSCRE